jgi:hypothetical protein
VNKFSLSLSLSLYFYKIPPEQTGKEDWNHECVVLKKVLLQFSMENGTNRVLLQTSLENGTRCPVKERLEL